MGLYFSETELIHTSYANFTTTLRFNETYQRLLSIFSKNQLRMHNLKVVILF